MIVVTGGSGQVGNEIKKIFKNEKEIYFPDRNTLNLENLSDVSRYFNNPKLKAVIHAGAYTNVELAEDQRELAKKINTDATRVIAEMSSKHKFKLTYISTDYVFDGKSSLPYTELDITSPLNHYGVTKLEGENAVRDYSHNPLILRTSWVYSVHGNNFVKKIISLASQQKELKVIQDQIGTLTYAEDLAGILSQSMDLTGIYHFSNEGCSSWYDVAREIVRILKFDVLVTPVLSSEYKTKATRPKYSLLNKSKITSALKCHLPHWTESLEKYLGQIHK
jgi:dTDP-4-dehydrorhamnose reductase